MREIKFRLIKNNEIVGYLAIGFNGKECGLLFSLKGDIWNHVNREGQLTQWDKAEQSTDHYDENDKEIYAGDTVICLYGSLHPIEPKPVVYDKEKAAYVNAWGTWKGIVVMGNIHSEKIDFKAIERARDKP